MIEIAKRVMNEGRHFNVLLNDLLQAFDWLPDDSIIAKLHAYGLKNDALIWIIESKDLLQPYLNS